MAKTSSGTILLFLLGGHDLVFLLPGDDEIPGILVDLHISAPGTDIATS